LPAAQRPGIQTSAWLGVGVVVVGSELRMIRMKVGHL